MRRYVRSTALTVAVAALAAPLALSSAVHADPLPGLALDPTWGDQGVAEVAHWGIDGADQHDTGHLAVGDGRGGAIVSLLTHGEDGVGFALVRVDEDGDLDPTFGTDGRVTTPCEAYAIEADAATIAVAGYGGAEGGPDAMCVGRLAADGSPDEAFGEDGWLTVSDPQDDVYPDGVQLGVDGSITVVSSTYDEDGPHDALVRRYAADGALDPSFGGDGIVDLTALTGSGAGTLAEVDALGRTVVLVEVPDHFGTSAARLTPAGLLDATWGTGGISADLGGVHDVGVSPRDGSVAAVHTHGDPGRVGRLDAAGRSDRRFAAGGVAELGVGIDFRPYVLALATGYTVVVSNAYEGPTTTVTVLDDHGATVAAETIDLAAEIPFGALWASPDGSRLFVATSDEPNDGVVADTTNIRSYVLDLPGLDPTISSVTPGRGALEVSWAPAERDTDGPVRAYEVQALQHGVVRAAQVVAGDVRQTTVTGLADGQAYDVVVRPYTGHGLATPSASSTGTPSAAAAAAGPASAPQGLSTEVARRATTVRWAPPTDDGGAPVIAYSVIAATAGTTQIVAFQNRPADARSASFPNLVAGQAYDLHVIAYTAAGYGAIATAHATASGDAAPAGKAAEVSWSAGAPTTSGVLVSWGPPTERGRVTTGFTVLTAREGVPLAAAVVGPNARSASLPVSGAGPVDVYVFAQSGSEYGPASGPTSVTR